MWTALKLAAIVAIVVGVVVYMTRPEWGVAELRKANPGWKVSGGYSPIHLDDGTAVGEVLVGGDDAGPVRVERIDCEEVRKVFPTWFQLPDAPIGNCARLGNAAPHTLVLNLRTTIPARELWERLYEPTADRLKLGYSGGSSSRGASDSANRNASSMGYSIDPAPGSGDRHVAIEAHSYRGATTAIFTFRPTPPP